MEKLGRCGVWPSIVHLFPLFIMAVFVWYETRFSQKQRDAGSTPGRLQSALALVCLLIGIVIGIAWFRQALTYPWNPTNLTHFLLVPQMILVLAESLLVLAKIDRSSLANGMIDIDLAKYAGPILRALDCYFYLPYDAKNGRFYHVDSIEALAVHAGKLKVLYRDRSGTYHLMTCASAGNDVQVRPLNLEETHVPEKFFATIDGYIGYTYKDGRRRCVNLVESGSAPLNGRVINLELVRSRDGSEDQIRCDYLIRVDNDVAVRTIHAYMRNIRPKGPKNIKSVFEDLRKTCNDSALEGIFGQDDGHTLHVVWCASKQESSEMCYRWKQYRGNDGPPALSFELQDRATHYAIRSGPSGYQAELWLFMEKGGHRWEAYCIRGKKKPQGPKTCFCPIEVYKVAAGEQHIWLIGRFLGSKWIKDQRVGGPHAYPLAVIGLHRRTLRWRPLRALWNVCAKYQLEHYTHTLSKGS